ncbi:MAG: DUF4968 domain-containing protein [Clostridiales bacterium]|nr:DUF4968 domain-containing protein [Clostridiales bacterium]
MKIIGHKIINVEQNEKDYSFFTNNGVELIISYLSAKTVRIAVRFDKNEEFDRSYAIEEIHYENVDTSFADSGEFYIIGSNCISVKIYKMDSKIEYIRNGKLITSVKEIGKDNEQFYCIHNMAPNEHFYGLGEDNDAYLGNMDRRGKKRELVTGQRINIGHVTADIPVSFFMSTGENTPYGIFVDSSYRINFDMGKNNSAEYSWSVDGGSFVYYLFAGNNFGEILNEYTNLTGKPSLPPLWALGYIQCRCSYCCWDEIDEIIDTLKEKRVPLDCIVFDFDWAENFHNFKWNKRWNGMSPQKILEYQKDGLHFMVSNSGPMIRKDSDIFQSALDAGILAKDKEGNTVTCGHYGGELMDFTNPNMKNWIKGKLENLLDEGVESWWLDLTEPEGDPDGTQYYDGDKAKVHNIFSLMNSKLYNEITLEHNSGKRPFILTRTGTAGIQKYNVAIWSGDVFSDYKTFAAHIPEALNTTMSGIPLWTSDSGGFMSSTSNSADSRNIYKNDVAAHAALYERWLQFAAFCPIMRVHHAGQSSPFIFGEMLTNSIAHYVRLRYRLIPYIYSYSFFAHITGEPIMRALVFDYMNDKNVLDIKDEFLFGKEILVAPVIEEKAVERTVYFPEGEWYDWDYGYKYEGGKNHVVYAPQNRIPVFVKGDAIIPMAEQTYNTKDIDHQKINLIIYPKAACSFKLFNDDGISYGFEENRYTETFIECVEDIGNNTKINITNSNLLYSPKEYLFEIHVNAIPVKVTYGDTELTNYGYKNLLKKTERGWYYDDFNNVLYIEIKDNAEKLDELVILHGAVVTKPIENADIDAVTGQIPFILPPASVPCRINCVNFDRGGEGVAFHKMEITANELYRTDGVEIELSDDTGAGHNVKNHKKSEWLEYTINVSEGGRYHIELRAQGTGTIGADFDMQTSLPPVTVDEGRWNTIDIGTVMLSMGEQVLRILVYDGCFRLNWIEFVKEY